jgi:hypothetical protein
VAILSGGAVGPGILTATVDVSVVGCRLHTRAGVWASPFVVATGTGYVFIQGSHFTGQHSQGMKGCIDGSLAGSVNGKVSVRDCRFPVVVTASGKAIGNFAASVVGGAENYQDGSGTAITGTQ